MAVKTGSKKKCLLVSQEKWRKENIGLMDSFLKLETILGAKNEEIMQK